MCTSGADHWPYLFKNAALCQRSSQRNDLWIWKENKMINSLYFALFGANCASAQPRNKKGQILLEKKKVLMDSV